MGWWSPPVNAHGLIREFIVSPAQLGGMGTAEHSQLKGSGPGMGYFGEKISWEHWASWEKKCCRAPGSSTTAPEFFISPFLSCRASFC